MKLMWQKQRAWSVLATLLLALLMLTAMLVGLGGARQVAAFYQDDGRGWWTDTFTDAVGLDVAVNVAVNPAQGRLELDAPTVFSQTDWSGGAGLLTTTVTSTNRYLNGARVNYVVAGDLSLGFTLPATDDLASFGQDGYPDLVMSNYITGPDPEDDFAEISYLYYGSETGFTDTHRSELSVTGSAANAVADLDNDGFLDIVIVRDGRDTSDDSDYVYIYWGSSDGYSESNRDSFGPTGYLGGCGVPADLDQDGYLDLVICNYMDASDPNPLNWNFLIDSYIYWGSSTGYASSNRTGLPTMGAVAAYAADFDQDGHLDLAFSNYRNSIYSAVTTTFAISSYLYYGDGTRTGYTATNPVELPTVGAYGHSVADLDRDGYLDIVFSNRRTGDNSTPTYALDSYVYWGSSTGFSEANRLELPTLGSYGNSLADLNGDGYPEIIFSNHYDGVTYTISSYIYWNDGGTFTTSDRSELPTIGATGNCVGDLNLDGYLDIVLSNRRSGNDHQVPSYIYWGDSSSEYTITNRANLTTHGALGCSIVGGTIAAANTSYGNVYAEPITGTTTITDTATTPRIYATAGVITSTGFDSGGARVWQQVTWNVSIPSGTDIALDVATSDDGSTWSAWSQVAASSSDGFNSAALNVSDARFIRYRATLNASTDHRLTPTLHDVQIIGGRTDGNATSVTITPASLDRWNTITWTAQVAAGQAITVQVLDSSSTLIPDGDLPGNSGGFSSSPVDISGLSVSSYPALRLRAWFSSDSVTATPSLDDWAVDWFVTPTSLTISPENDTITAGDVVTYSVFAHDDYGGSWEVTADSQYTITLAAGGHWADNVYASEFADTWAVTGTYGSLSVTTDLTVQHTTAVAVEIMPGSETVVAGETVTYTVVATDTHGNSWDATGEADFDIEAEADGHWTVNVYASETAGTWTVTGTVDGVDGLATLTVNSGVLDHVVIEDAAGGAGSEVTTHSMDAGETFDVWAAGYDQYDNYIGDESVTWSGTGVVAGRLAPTSGISTTFTAQDAGTGTIQADHATATDDDTGTITVNPAGLDHVVIENAAGGAGSEVTTHSMDAGETFDVWAAGYDQYDNYIGDESVTWSGTGVVAGHLAPTSGVSTTFTAQDAGTGTIQADHATATDDDTGTIAVNPAGLDHVVIENAAGGAGSEVTTHSMNAGETFDVWAAGYDQYDNYIGDESVTWSGTGVVAGRLAPTSGISTTFTAQDAGTGTIQADHATATDDDTGTITVNPGVLDHVVIEDAAGGAGSEVTTHLMDAGETFDVWAAGYDVGNNYLGDYSVTWSGTGVVAGRLSPTSGVSTTFTAQDAGTGTIQADHDTATDDDTGTITVNPAGLDHVVIEDAAGGTGSEVTTHSMNAGETFDVWAAGYDVGDNYLGDYSVTWSGTGVVAGRLAPTSGVSTTFTAGTAGTGTIQADHDTATDDDTGTITVNPAGLDHVVIEDAAGGAGSAVNTHTMTAGETFDVWAAGYDVGNNYIGDESVTWSGTGVVAGRLSPTSGVSTTFTAQDAGTGTIQADHDTAIDDDTGTITVNAGVLDHVVIEDAAGGAGSEVTTHSMDAGETFDVWAAGYDQYDNYIGDESVTWSGTGVVAGRLSPTSGISTTFTAQTVGTGTIQADHATATDDDTGTITVNPAGLDHVVIEDAAGGTGSAVNTHTMNAGETFDVWAAGYDQYDNYIGDESVTWSGTGVVAGRLAPTSGVSTTFTAGTAGTGTIQADHATATDDDTGTITVNLGVLDHVVIEDAAGGAGSAVGTHTLNAGETFDVWAAGYDVGNNYLGDYSVAWSGTGVVAGRLSPTSGVSTTFTAQDAGTGTIRADHDTVTDDDTGAITVNPGSLHHFVFAAISSQTADQLFSVTITAQDEYGNTVTGYTGVAVLTDTTGTINPTVTGNFVGGVWTGDVTIAQAQSDVTITAEDGSVSGSSNSFDVTKYKIYLPLVVRGG